MVPVESIVVPTDFGEAAAAAFEHAVALARRFDAEIVVLHAQREGRAHGGGGGDLAASGPAVDDAQARLDVLVRAAKQDGVAARTLLRTGEPWHIIMSTADELGASMIVMGSELRDGTPRAQEGALAEKLVRTSRVPVLVVPVVDEPARSSMDVDLGERTVRSMLAVDGRPSGDPM